MGKKRILLGVRLLASAALIVLLGQLIDGQRLVSALRSLKLLPLVLAAGGEWLFYAIESVRLRLMFRRSYTWLLLFRSRVLSVFVGNFLPGISSAELVRLFLLDAHEPGRKVRIGTILVANRIYGLLALAVIFALMLGFWPHYLPGFAPASLRLVAGLLLMGVGLAVMLPGHRLLRWRLALALRAHRQARLARLARKLYLALTPVSRINVWPLALSSSVLTNLICIGQFWLLGQAVGLNEGFGFWAVLVPLVGIGSFLPLGIGVIGPQDFTIVSMVAYLGREVEPFVLLSLLMHSIRILGSLLGLCFLDDMALLVRTFSSSPRLRALFERLSAKGRSRWSAPGP